MPRFALMGSLVAVALAHVAFMLLQPAPHPTGDELHYIALARDDAAHGALTPLPGWLRFGHRPELVSRLWASLVAPGVSDASLVRRASCVNLALLLGLLGLVYAQARACAASRRAAFAAAAVVACFPWLGFHVHSLWPEIVHAALLGVALLAALRHLASGGLLSLGVCGVATGVALLAKGTLAPFVPLFALVFAANAWWPTREAAPGGGRAALRGVSLYLGAVLLVVGPQLAANWNAGHGSRLAANRWWNLEIGVTLPVDASDPSVLSAGGVWLPEQAQTLRYARAAPRAVGREAAARQRTLDYLAAHGLREMGSAQVGKLFDLLWAGPGLLPQRQASFDQALGARARWGSPPPGWVSLWQEPARWAWRLLLPLGLFGLLAGARVSRPRLLLALFAVSFLLAALAVPVKVRFLLPSVPVLALGVGFLVDRLAARWPAPAATS